MADMVEAIVAEMAMQKLAIDYWWEVDLNDARNLTDFYTEDCTYVGGPGLNYIGHQGILDFYANSRSIRGAEPREVRHMVSNVKVTVSDANSGSVLYMLSTYSGYGVAPMEVVTAPAQITQIALECVRGGDGKWRIARFSGLPIFMGAHSLTKKLAGWKS